MSNHLKILGVLNLTQDSFFDGGRYFDPKKAAMRAHEIEREGADILDIGAESTRPGAIPVSEEEELSRIRDFFKRAQISIPISIDTRKPKVAALATDLGATYINDVSGFTQKEMRDIAAKSGAKCIVMHMQNTPETMQDNPSYPEGIVEHLLSWFTKQVDIMLESGIAKENIILDPGIGFGKTSEHIFTIIQNISKLKTLGYLILIGASRKSFMQRTLHKSADELLHATLVMHTLAATNGATYLRAHDIAPHKDMATLLQYPHGIG